MLNPRDERPAERKRLRDWLALAEALCLSPVRALECLEASGGDPVRALACGGSRSRASSGQLEAALEILKAREVRVVPITSRAYPPPLRALPDPPPVLFLLGEIPDWSRPTVAIVGARAATRYGLAVAERLAHELALAGVVVVSGLALGVDGAAHRGALRGGTTWAVLGCGIDIHYPAEHRNLSKQITHSGAVLSELPPGRPPAAPHFPLRNRIISGLWRDQIKKAQSNQPLEKLLPSAPFLVEALRKHWELSRRQFSAQDWKFGAKKRDRSPGFSRGSLCHPHPPFSQRVPLDSYTQDFARPMRTSAIDGCDGAELTGGSDISKDHFTILDI